MRKTKTGLIWLWLSALVVVLDQLVKVWMMQHLSNHQVMPVFFSWLNFSLAFNAGAAFSFLGNAGGWQVYFFSAISLFIVILFSVWLVRMPRCFYWRGLGLSLIIGGAVGNLIDRLRFNYVVDFIDVHFGGWHFATFNIADSAISVGAFFLIVSLLFAKHAASNVGRK